MKSLVLAIILALLHQALASMEFYPKPSDYVLKRRVYADESAHIYWGPSSLARTWDKDLALFIGYSQYQNPSLSLNSVRKIAKDTCVLSVRDAIDTRTIKLSKLRDSFGRSVLFFSLHNPLLLQVFIGAADGELPKLLFMQGQGSYSELGEESILHYYAQYYFGHHDDDIQIIVAKILLRAVVPPSLEPINSASVLLQFIRLKHDNESAIYKAKNAKNIALAKFLEGIQEELEQGRLSQVWLKLSDLPW